MCVRKYTCRHTTCEPAGKYELKYKTCTRCCTHEVPPLKLNVFLRHCYALQQWLHCRKSHNRGSPDSALSTVLGHRDFAFLEVTNLAVHQHTASPRLHLPNHKCLPCWANGISLSSCKIVSYLGHVEKHTGLAPATCIVSSFYKESIYMALFCGRAYIQKHWHSIFPRERGIGLF